jgi:hypothetical protein
MNPCGRKPMPTEPDVVLPATREFLDELRSIFKEATADIVDGVEKALREICLAEESRASGG